MEDANITTMLISIGGTICIALITALKILWNKVESLTEVIIESGEKIGRLEGRSDYIEGLHKEILDIIENQNKDKE